MFGLLSDFLRVCVRAFTLLKATPFTHFGGVTHCSEPLTVCRSSSSSPSSTQPPALGSDPHTTPTHTHDAQKHGTIDSFSFCLTSELLAVCVFLQAGRDFLHGAPEGGRGGTRPADRHAHRRQQRVDKGDADRGRHAVLNTRLNNLQGLCPNDHISLY